MQLPVLDCGFKLLRQNCAHTSLSLFLYPSRIYLSRSYLIGCCSCRRASPFMRFTYRSRLKSHRIFVNFYAKLPCVIFSFASAPSALFLTPTSSPCCLCVWLKLSTKVTQSLINFLRQTQTDWAENFCLLSGGPKKCLRMRAQVYFIIAAAASLATLSLQIKSTQIAFPTLIRSFFYFMAATQCHKVFYSHNWQTQLQLHLSPGYQIYRGQTFSTALQTDTPGSQTA